MILLNLLNVFLHHTHLANLLSAHIQRAVDSISFSSIFCSLGLSPCIPYVCAPCHLIELTHSVVVHELMSAHCQVPSVTTPLLKEVSIPPQPPVLSPLIVTTLVSPGKTICSAVFQLEFRLYFSPVLIIRLP